MKTIRHQKKAVDKPNKDIQEIISRIELLEKIVEIMESISPNNGLDGLQGAQGENGKDGEAGPIGPTGKTGPIGIQGPQGIEGIQGTQGIQGVQGLQGTAGKNGEDGKDREPETLDTLRKKLDPILKEIYAGLRGNNYGGFIETSIKAGTNISVSKDASGAWVITSTGGSSGGSGFQRPISGVVDGVNQTFVWATAPNAITTDEGRSFQKIQYDGMGGTNANWSGTTTTVLTVAPNFDIFSPS